MQFGEGKTAKQAQRETMNDFTPSRLVADASWRGEITVKKMRVWADNQYRGQNVKWQQTFDSTLEIANLVLAPVFGLRVVAEYRVWDHHVPGNSLANDLLVLASRDPGDDVFAVVGLTSSLPLVSATFDDLGMAQIGGRHMILRGYADLEERKQYEAAFRDLTQEERELALQQRREHKTAVVFLHELAHNLGAEHDAEENMITSAGYSHRAKAFSASARDVMMRSIDARLGRASTKPETAPAPPQPEAAREPLVFHVDAAGRVMRGEQVVDDATLDKLLADAFASSAQTEIAIKRARKAPAAVVNRIVSRATAIGLTRVSMSLY
jgi:biopolymer transport protein ExbD